MNKNKLKMPFVGIVWLFLQTVRTFTLTSPSQPCTIFKTLSMKFYLKHRKNSREELHINQKGAIKVHNEKKTKLKTIFLAYFGILNI